MQPSLQKIFTVSEFTYAIKSHLEPYFQGISIEGEVSNLKLQSSGHLYFTLKDKEAQLSCVLFKGNAVRQEKLPKDGDQIIAKGELSIYPPRGNYQLIVRELSFSGVGELLLKLHELKEKLKALGWFALEHKKPIPKFPKTIGIVTSPTGAVIQDILNVLNRRFYNTHILLNPVKVQGEGAAAEIALAIDDFNRFGLADVLIVGRGGGSLEDLWAFNEEVVAKAIFASKIPIISAVGHETDHSIADLVSDLRAPTPSAAAELVIGEREKYLKDLSGARREMVQNITHHIDHYKGLLRTLSKQGVLSSSYTLLGKEMQRMDDAKEQLDRSVFYLLEKKKALLISMDKQTRKLNPLFQLKMSQEKLKNAREALTQSWSSLFRVRKKALETKNFSQEIASALFQKISLAKERLISLKNHLCSLDPKELLKKGYSILFSEKEGSIILSTKELKKDQKFSALLSDGKIFATIDNIEENKWKKK